MGVTSHRDLDVYQRSFALGMAVFKLSKSFPKEEIYSLTDQIRRSSRAVSANIAEGWRKRRYEAAFVSKLNDAEGEAAEVQVWLDYAAECEYCARGEASELANQYEKLIGSLVGMIHHAESWCLPPRRSPKSAQAL